MPEQKMTYKERLIGAEIMIQMGDKSAIIAAQAAAIRKFNKHVIPDWSEENEPFANEVIEQYLLEHGYIEPKTEYDGNA